jgi:hypothetical protein
MPIPLIPIRLLGLALARKTYMEKNGKNPIVGKGITLPVPFQKPRPKPVHNTRDDVSMPNPIQNLVKSLSSSFSGLSSTLTNLTASVTRMIQKPPKEDYGRVVKTFISEGSVLQRPENPVGTDDYQIIDLDGGTRNAIAASYKYGNDINAIVLKRHDGRWTRVADIAHSNYDKLNYMGFADVTGEGKKQLLVGLKNKDQHGELHGYALQGSEANKIFTHKYHKFEVLNTSDNRGNPAKPQIAFWNNGDTLLDRIEVKHWNGLELEPVSNPGKYYNRKVLPVYGQRVKQQPQNAANWFKLADALTKAGMYRDALDSVNIGMRLNPVSPSKEDFLELKNIIMEKMKK